MSLQESQYTTADKKSPYIPFEGNIWILDTHKKYKNLGFCHYCIYFFLFKNISRFFFTHSGATAKSAGNPAPFTPAQLSALRRRTLRDLVCENTAVARAKGDFLKIQGEEADCRETNSLDFDLFT